MIALCNGTIYHNNKPWFSFISRDYRPVIQDIYELGYKPPFKVRIGETVFLRDDGSVSLPFVLRNRILFPLHSC